MEWQEDDDTEAAANGIYIPGVPQGPARPGHVPARLVLIAQLLMQAGPRIGGGKT